MADDSLELSDEPPEEEDPVLELPDEQPEKESVAKWCASYFKSKLCNMTKTQKLLYYAQGIHMKIYCEPLFEEDISAWNHGPVVPRVYYAGFDKLPEFDREEHPWLDDFLGDILEAYGEYSVNELVEKTLQELPLIETGRYQTIQKELIASYFKDVEVGNRLKRRIRDEKEGNEYLEDYVETLRKDSTVSQFISTRNS